MPGKWRAIAPLWQYWDSRYAIGEGVELAGGVRLLTTPEFIRTAKATQYLAVEMRDRVLHEAPFSLSLEYEASRLGEPDPDWAGPGESTKQRRVDYTLILASMALWLAKPAHVGFEVVFHSSETDELAAGEISYPGLLCPREADAENQLDLDDYEIARELHASLIRVPREGTMWSAVVFLWKALKEREWEPRMVSYWIAMEALFGPEDTRGEIRFRLSQRAAFFLSQSRSEAANLFAVVKEGYDWRSKIVHGNRLRKLDDQKARRLGGELQDLVRASVTRILLGPELVETFNSEKREQFLDGLPFKG